MFCDEEQPPGWPWEWVTEGPTEDRGEGVGPVGGDFKEGVVVVE